MSIVRSPPSTAATLYLSYVPYISVPGLIFIFPPKAAIIVPCKLELCNPVAFFKLATIASFDIIVIVVLLSFIGLDASGIFKSISIPVAFPPSIISAPVKSIFPTPSEYAA